MAATFDRTTEDMGNIVEFGHVNFKVAEPRIATSFYLTGLGLTRDPIMMTGNDNMWVNVGDSQFHLPTGKATHAPVTLTGLVVPSREKLLARLARVRGDLEGTQFSFTERNDSVEITCPWGNRLRCHDPDVDRFGPYRLNMAYVEFEIARGAAGRIAAFYKDLLGARVELTETSGGAEARVTVGDHQVIVFRELDNPHAPCLAHHVQIYIADFSKAYGWLAERGLITKESGPHQYVFQSICDPTTGEVVFELEHEVRSLRHPMYGRSLVNRNPDQDIRSYQAGHDHFVWRMD